jgi:flagellar protein FliL
MAADSKTETKEPADKVEEGGDAAAELLAAGPRKLSMKRVALLVVPLVLAIGGGLGAFVTGLLDPLLGIGAHAAVEPVAEDAAKQAIYFDLPEMLVNLNGNGRRASYLRVVVALEVGTKEDLERLEQVKPRIIDNFQVFLRELRVEDLRGSAGMYRLKEELLARVNESARPATIKDVLFREMLVQ